MYILHGESWTPSKHFTKTNALFVPSVGHLLSFSSPLYSIRAFQQSIPAASSCVLFPTFKDSNYLLLPYVKIGHNSFPKCFIMLLKYYFLSLKYYFYFYFFFSSCIFSFVVSLIVLADRQTQQGLSHPPTHRELETHLFLFF
jgi:hypothetical protein